MSADQSRPGTARSAHQSARSRLAVAWWRLAGAGGEVDATRSDHPGGPVPPADPDQSAWSAWRSARQLARLVRDAWPVVVGGWLPDLADQVPYSRERQPGHPRW